MPVTAVQLFSISVSDQDRSIDFYVHTLGFELVADMPMGPEMRWVQIRPVGGATSITLVTWFPTMPAGSTKGTVLETSSLESDIELFRSKGVDIGEIDSAPWGRFVTFDDPDGNGIVLQETTLPQ
jgi:catechol 2,3-dioxygenase-like lactoylglutathione lyase family enzyme